MLENTVYISLRKYAYIRGYYVVAENSEGVSLGSTFKVWVVLNTYIEYLLAKDRVKMSLEQVGIIDYIDLSTKLAKQVYPRLSPKRGVK